MKSFRFLSSAALMLLATVVLAQPDMHKSEAVQKADAQKSFEQLKTLAGTWNATVQATPPDPDIDGAKLEVALRVTSRGNALVHELQEAGTPLDPAKYGKKVEFDFTDVSGGNEYGHLYHAVFTTIDADPHTEDWTYMMPGDKPMQAHMDLVRAK